jgi:hypothetical protein
MLSGASLITHSHCIKAIPTYGFLVAIINVAFIFVSNTPILEWFTVFTALAYVGARATRLQHHQTMIDRESTVNSRQFKQKKGSLLWRLREIRGSRKSAHRQKTVYDGGPGGICRSGGTFVLQTTNLPFFLSVLDWRVS